MTPPHQHILVDVTHCFPELLLYSKLRSCELSDFLLGSSLAGMAGLDRAMQTHH